MRVRTYEEIKKSILIDFQKEFPSEPIMDSVFSIYILDRFCRLVENHDLYKYMVRTGKDL